jgi:Cytochrome c/c1 heme lyase
MGSSQSTPTKTSATTSSSAQAVIAAPSETIDGTKSDSTTIRSTNIAVNDTDIKDNAEKSSGGGGGGCPMKKSDGSYTFNLGLAMFSPKFPHRPGTGNVPLNQEQIDASKEGKVITTDANNEQQQDKVNATAGGGGCPMKSSSNKKLVEYNVYSQPIVNPNNNMPQNPNQLPASTQSVPLSTHRVSSTIPKVCIFLQKNSVVSDKTTGSMFNNKLIFMYS